ncbi:uncharacterized protein LOC121598736 [Anopheles merus]|uniref:uncharacterized protein LOC121598736 n=1 Tax=Anopheles merus TaxID=30066 RepID=UPI001BE45183|nr:uncharacterized protein LOC121598736 [Anopheles merus]
MSDSKQEGAMGYSSGTDTDTDDGLPHEVPLQDRPFGEASFEDRLTLWALPTSQTHRALVLSLAHIRQHQSHCKLPRDPRTLMHIPVSTEAEITSIGGGRLWDRGVATCLQQYYRNVKPLVKGSTFLQIDFFVDGMPLYKSSRSQFWLILMIVFILPDSPVMVVAIFCGKSKPHSQEEYLRRFVEEMNDLQKNHLAIGQQLYWICLRAIIADAPARSFIKGKLKFIWRNLVSQLM